MGFRNLCSLARTPISFRQKLVDSPYLMNSLSAVLIMGLGDALAQQIQIRNELHEQLAVLKGQQIHGHHHQTNASSNSDRPPVETTPESHDKVASEIQRWVVGGHSWLRSGIMCGYSFFFFAPCCVFIYAKMSRIPFETYKVLQTKNGSTFLVSLARAAVANVSMAAPMNIVFFSYATAVEYRCGSLQGAGEETHENSGAAVQRSFSDPRLRLLIEKKIRDDVLTTISTSALFWIPITTINFQFVPLNFRTIFASSMGVCWNTFLSWIQHKQ